MSSQHARLRSLVRAELRSLLASLLAALPPVGPVARPSPPPEGSDALAAALAAWEALGGVGRGIMAGEAVEAGRERPEAWAAFMGGVERLRGEKEARRLRALAAAGGAADRKAAHALGQVLRQLRGRMVGGRVLVGEVTRTGSMRWRVAGAP